MILIISSSSHQNIEALPLVLWLGCLFPWIGKAEGGSDSALEHSGKDALQLGEGERWSRGSPSWLKCSSGCLFSPHFLVEKVVLDYLPQFTLWC